MSRGLSKPALPSSPLVPDVGALGHVVRAARLTARLRIDDAAALCGVSVTVLSRLENAASSVTTRNLFKVLDGLGLSLLALDKAAMPRTLETFGGPAQSVEPALRPAQSVEPALRPARRGKDLP